VSNITSADGKFLRNGILTGSDSTPYWSTTDWPRQGRPPKLWWSLWKNKLQGALSQNGVSPTLRHPLGEWSKQAQTAEWDVRYSGMTGRSEIFCRQPEGDYKVYADIVASRGQHQFVSSTSIGRVNHCPNDSVPASLGPRWKDGRQRVSFRKQSNQCTDVPDTGMVSFTDFVEGQPEYIRTLLQHADLSDATAKAVADQATTPTTLSTVDLMAACYLITAPLAMCGPTTRPRTPLRRAMDKFLAIPTGCLPHDLNCAAFSQHLRT
jgi:hypothetical protein